MPRLELNMTGVLHPHWSAFGGRKLYAADLTGTDYDDDNWDPPRRQVTMVEKANLVSSETIWGSHKPALDIDFPCRLVETSPERYHLYIDRPMSWRTYRRLLKALHSAGIIEKGFYQLSIRRKATFLRTHKKGAREKL